MKKMIFVSAFLILIFLLISPVFSSGGQARTGTAASGPYQRDPNLNPPGTFPINRNTVALRIGVAQNPLVEDFQTNWMTRQFEERGNYTLTFDTFPQADFDQRVQLMMMSGGDDLPDVLMTSGSFNLSRLVSYADAGMVIPLNMYYENSAHYINQQLQHFDIDVLRYVTSYDGNIYGIPRIADGIGDMYSSNVIMMYKPWLERLGYPQMPRTITEFENVLTAIRDRDPNGNGIRDEIPLISDSGGSLSNMLRALMNPFIYTQANYWIVENGRIDVVFNKPAWRDGLRYANRLLEQGLISPLSYTQNATQMNAMINSDPQTVGAFARISASNLPLNSELRHNFYRFQPLEGPGGTNVFKNLNLPSIRMIITSNCRTPESAFMLGDFMISEEMSLANRYGEYGVDWATPGPGLRAIFASLGFQPRILSNLGAPWGSIQNKYYAQTGPHFLPGIWSNGTTTDLPSSVPWDDFDGSYLIHYIAAANDDPVVGIIYNEREQQIMDEFHLTIINYVHESYTRFVTGDLSIDRDWDRYIAEFGRMGLADVIRATQSAWDRMHGR